ncbi:MAG: hypothetical protein JW806_07450 [Sedimentisphaerales bacterium]|nr:hypothetical protein [Sedimentisphaerales bacterium]
MIFLTVGTYPLAFERLIRVVDEMVRDGVIKEKVFAQIGQCTYKPKNMDYVDMLNKEVFDDYFNKASAVISHAGIGAIEMALKTRKPLLIMPRLRKYNEVVNDHQEATAIKFEQMGHVLAAYNEKELREKFKELELFVPQPREDRTKAVADRIARFLNEL